MKNLSLFLQHSRTGRLLAGNLVLALAVVYFLALWPVVPGLASGNNLKNLFSNMLPLLIVAVGQTFVLITAGIDLSVTSLIALSSVTGALIMNEGSGWMQGSLWSVPVALLAMLFVGTLLGLMNGLAVARLGMPPFMVTLTVMMFAGGFAIWLTQSRNLYQLPRLFIDLAQKSWLGVPNALVLTVLLAALAHIVLSRSLLGRWIYAVGINPVAAEISGVPVGRTIVWAYALSGFCAAVASILYTGRLETGSPVLGRGIFLDVIGAVVIGGNSLSGGRGKILWTVFGVLFISLVDNSLNLLGLSNFNILMVKGGIILLAALLDALRSRWIKA